MAKPAVTVEGLGKRYKIGVHTDDHPTIRDAITGMITAPLRNLRRLAEHGSEAEMFWALRDVNFQLAAGEVVGIIGGNGAGKSTLLKILSRITDPTTGSVRLRGRVASLLEVGTGFHPELTGRENIYLNGSILGMRKSEISRRFDEIVAFSEIEQFLDTPVKRYSSGMYVRLAFAVAAHLDPEILIVDEVLAVGDGEFQRKCLGKMQQVAAGGGRTVMFVSHNMSAIQRLCSRGLLIRRGRLVSDGKVDDVVREYLAHFNRNSDTAFELTNPDREGNGPIRFTGGRVLDEHGRQTSQVAAGRPISLEFNYSNPNHLTPSNFYFIVYNHLGVPVTTFDSKLSNFALDDMGPEGVIACRIPKLPLPLGEYRVLVAIKHREANLDLVPNALIFTVDASSFLPSMATPPIQCCSVMIEHEWSHEAIIQPDRTGVATA